MFNDLFTSIFKFRTGNRIKEWEVLDTQKEAKRVSQNEEHTKVKCKILRKKQQNYIMHLFINRQTYINLDLFMLEQRQRIKIFYFYFFCFIYLQICFAKDHSFVKLLYVSALVSPFISPGTTALMKTKMSEIQIPHVGGFSL